MKTVRSLLLACLLSPIIGAPLGAQGAAEDEIAKLRQKIADARARAPEGPLPSAEPRPAVVTANVTGKVSKPRRLQPPLVQEAAPAPVRHAGALHADDDVHPERAAAVAAAATAATEQPSLAAVQAAVAAMLDSARQEVKRMLVTAEVEVQRMKADATRDANANAAASAAGHASAVPASATPVLPDINPKPSEPPALTWGGSADFYVSVNGGHPTSGRNALRAFDVVDGHGIQDGLMDAWVQLARRPIGFRLDVGAGATTQLVNAVEPSHAKLWQYIQQAFVGVNLAKDGSTFLEAGKWVTPAGAELIEPADNWLSSRGLLFTWAIPFYHAGARVTHSLNATDYVAAHVNRGWNAVGNPRHGLGFGASASKAINDRWTVSAHYLGGEEAAITGGTEMQHLLDIVALFNASDRWSFTLNSDVARQPSASWYGLSVQARRAIGASAFTVRGETLADVNGKLLGTKGARLASFTLGHSVPWGKHFVSRIEFRQDTGDRSVLAAQGVGGPGQPTLLASFIVKY